MNAMTFDQAKYYLSRLITPKAKQQFLDWLKETNPAIWEQVHG